jgi:hypothetical protein
MTPPPGTAAFIARLMPDATPEQAAEACRNFDGFLRVVLRIARRNADEQAASDSLDSRTQGTIPPSPPLS